MNKKKNWDILIESSEIPKNKIVSKHKKIRMPLFVRLIISFLIYCVAYAILSYSLPRVAEYINQIVGVFFAAIGFIITSYKDYKNKLYNEIYGRKGNK